MSRTPLLVMLGAQWRWDDDSLADPDLRGLLDSSTRANSVVRTKANTTVPAAGFRTLATGNRMGSSEKGWTLGRAVLDSGTHLRLFGDGAAAGLGFVHPDAPDTKLPDSLNFSPDSSYRGASPEVFADLLSQVMSPEAVVVVDMRVFPRRLQPQIIRAAWQRGDDSGWNTIVASIADDKPATNQESDVYLIDKSAPQKAIVPPGNPRLQVFAARGPQFGNGGATSASTHRPGWVQTSDLTATILDYVGAQKPAWVQGSTITTGNVVTVESLASAARRAAMIRNVQVWFLPGLGVGLALLLIAAVWTLNRRTHPRLGEDWEQPRALLGFWRMVATFAALIPAMAYLMNLVPWWELGPADTDVAAASYLWLGCLLPVILSALAAIVWSALGLNFLLGPLFIISISSLIVGVLDPLIGSPMVLDSIMGLQSTVGGRFFGIDNVMFALLATGALTLATVAYGLVEERKQPNVSEKSLMVVLVVLAGAVIILDAAPSLGADFGGTMALVPGFAVLFLKFNRKPLTILSSAMIVLLTVAVAATFAYLDWLRPAEERTHLGNFIDTLAQGRVLPVLINKSTMVWNAGWPAWLIIGVILAILLALAIILAPLFANMRNPYRRDYGWLWGSIGAKLQPEGITWNHAEKALFTAWCTTMVVAMLLNDSGILLGMAGAAVMFPAILAQGCHKFLTDQPQR
ncbi:hypothetical protein [uncultured Mobiluncus sp.]|uniref:hypothetical protein n=1 Tax=uncultured Mobiluncus sp. TaxID=293425 RepID=UPI0025CF789E|nr:hypothetical protein [uncultured Mobiluncus sp.]